MPRLYFNSVVKGSGKGGLSWFAGVAGSLVWEKVDGAIAASDRYCHRMSELHVKAKVSKRLSPAVKATWGAESFLRHAGMGPQQNGPRYYRQALDSFDEALKLNPDNDMAKELQEKFRLGMEQTGK